MIVEEIRGWLTQQIAYEMRELVLQVRPSVCVEIGVYCGRSLVNTALALQQNGTGVVYGIDSWRVEDVRANLGTGDGPNDQPSFDWEAIHRECMNNIWSRELERYAIVIRSASQYVHKLFNRDIDILYIDGGHSEENSTRDADLYEPNVRKNGYIWFDDADWPSTQKAQERLKPFCEIAKDYGYAKLFRKQ